MSGKAPSSTPWQVVTLAAGVPLAVRVRKGVEYLYRTDAQTLAGPALVLYPLVHVASGPDDATVRDVPLSRILDLRLAADVDYVSLLCLSSCTVWLMPVPACSCGGTPGGVDDRAKRPCGCGG